MGGGCEVIGRTWSVEGGCVSMTGVDITGVAVVEAGGGEVLLWDVSVSGVECVQSERADETTAASVVTSVVMSAVTSVVTSVVMLEVTSVVISVVMSAVTSAVPSVVTSAVTSVVTSAVTSVLASAVA